MDNIELSKAAISAMERAYAPYSGCRVGAALLCSDGSIFTGCNIENAAFGPTVCAERTAIFKAISEGKRAFVKMAVAGGKNGTVNEAFMPCGVCRQVISEFCSDDFEILCVSTDGIAVFKLSDLLPMRFSPENVKGSDNL
ncbi:MAG: cytidine deaminase [Ruminococcaceae bacterium]|nr:cytidine deaminase [Oscillospiraceae bacterium]